MPPETPPPEQNQQVWRHIQDAVQSLKFGTVEITVHDSKVVQIERKEKLRFPSR